MSEHGQGARRSSGRSFGGPGKYIQCAGEIGRLAHHIQPLGRLIFVLMDRFVFERMGDDIGRALGASGLTVKIEPFGGECCNEEIARVTGLAQAFQADVIVGIGGGKTADTAKLTAITTKARIVIVPTIASTDAPCSAIAVRYDSHGVYQESMFLPRNPDIVIVDSAVIAAAPVRFLVAGIGDALSTWFEARSNLDSGSNNLGSGPIKVIA